MKPAYSAAFIDFLLCKDGIQACGGRNSDPFGMQEARVSHLDDGWQHFLSVEEYLDFDDKTERLRVVRSPPL